MRKVKYMDMMRHNSRLLRFKERNGLIVPENEAAGSAGLKCQQCNGVLCDKEEMEWLSNEHLEVRGWHHGKEDAVRIKWDWRPTEDEQLEALRSVVLFPRDSQQDH